MISAILAFLLQTAAPAVSQPPYREQAKVGDLMIVQLWTDKPDAFLNAWNQPSPPNLGTTTKIQRKKPITAFVIFAGCKGDTAGNCKLTGDIEFRDPDGQPYGAHRNIDFWSGVAIEGYELRLSPAGSTLVVEDGEKLGEYAVRITVTDDVAKAVAVTEQKIDVVESSPE